MVAHARAKLDNGLDIVAVEQPYLHSTDVAYFVRCGSRHESANQWGLSHLLEHMLFRGSAKYPGSLALAQALERNGGSLNASTWRDHTRLSGTVQPARLRAFLDVLSDMIQRPRFDDLEVERAIVAEELQSDLDDAGSDVDINNISRAAIWSGHPMGRRIAGSPETLRAFGENDVREHHARHYVGPNAVLCIAGRSKAAEVIEMAAEAFAAMPSGAPAADGEAARFVPGSRITARQAEGSQLHVQLCFEALPDLHADFIALQLLTRVLDDGIGSRLQQAVCEKRGLVYELTTGLDCYADCGLYDIEMRVAPRRAASAIAATLEALQRLCDEGVNDEELASVRERSLHELECRVDSTSEMATHFGAATLFGAPASLEEEARQLLAVEPADVQRVAQRLFAASKVHATLLGPVERANMKRIEALIEGFARASR